jgi:hypothetical protein
MRFTLPILFAAALLPPQAQADFQVYRVELSWINRAAIVWQIWDSPPSCQHVWDNLVWWENSGDVSGNKLGFRCKGSGCSQTKPPQDIAQLEMHFSNSPKYHLTMYKDRGRAMFGLDGKQYGSCSVKTAGNYDCNIVGALQQLKGRRKFHCKYRLSAPQLRDSVSRSFDSGNVAIDDLTDLYGEPQTLREWFLSEMDEATIEAAGGADNLTMVPIEVPIEVQGEDKDEDEDEEY